MNEFKIFQISYQILSKFVLTNYSDERKKNKLNWELLNKGEEEVEINSNPLGFKDRIFNVVRD